MSKPEKYWLFGMVLMLSVKHQEIPTMLGSISNVISYIGAFVCFLVMVLSVIRGKS